MEVIQPPYIYGEAPRLKDEDDHDTRTSHVEEETMSTVRMAPHGTMVR
jgi:hypothetical protein